MLELPKKEKFEIIEKNNLNHHQFRFVVLPITFDYFEFINSGKIISSESPLLIQYNGTDKPMILSASHGFQLVG